MINERDGGFFDDFESFNNENNNNEDNKEIIDEKQNEQNQKFDKKEETEDPFSAFQEYHRNDESLDLINGIASISSNNPSIRSHHMSEVQRPGLTENSNHGTIKMSMTEVTSYKTKKQ